MYFRKAKKVKLANEFFIAKKIFFKETEGKKVSRPIVRISVISIALSIVVNLLTIAVVIGFQKEVREKVSGFSAHAILLKNGSPNIFECEPLLQNDSLLSDLRKLPSVDFAQEVAFKPMLLQSERMDRKIRTADGKDSSFSQQDIQGTILKGVKNDYDWRFLTKHLTAGRIPKFPKDSISDQILISESLAKSLQFKVGDTVRTFFVKNNPVKRFFQISGIYKTGLEEFDKKMVFGDLRAVQNLNDWGLTAQIEVLDTLADGFLVIKANVQGGNGYYLYDWGKGFASSVGIKICPQQDTVFRLIAKDYNGFGGIEESSLALPDTAYLKIKISGNKLALCDFQLNQNKEIEKEYLTSDGLKYKIRTPDKTIHFEHINGHGSADRYIGGWEVGFKDWSKIDQDVNELKTLYTFIPTSNGEQLQVTGVKENQQEIFVWLDFLDLNVLIILTLMIVIGIVNVGAALLVIILVKTQFIGLMKAMGSWNWQVRKIFLTQAFFIIGKGMIWGNAIGLGLCFLQAQFGLLKLNAEVYYLSSVPIAISWWQIILLNVVTLVVCLAAMILPSTLISRVNPTKAIKFQ